MTIHMSQSWKCAFADAAVDAIHDHYRGSGASTAGGATSGSPVAAFMQAASGVLPLLGNLFGCSKAGEAAGQILGMFGPLLAGLFGGGGGNGGGGYESGNGGGYGNYSHHHHHHHHRPHYHDGGCGGTSPVPGSDYGPVSAMDKASSETVGKLIPPGFTVDPQGLELMAQGVMPQLKPIGGVRTAGGGVAQVLAGAKPPGTPLGQDVRDAAAHMLDKRGLFTHAETAWNRAHGENKQDGELSRSDCKIVSQGH